MYLSAVISATNEHTRSGVRSHVLLLCWQVLNYSQYLLPTLVMLQVTESALEMYQ